LGYGIIIVVIGKTTSFILSNITDARFTSKELQNSASSYIFEDCIVADFFAADFIVASCNMLIRQIL